jgi:small subunit ribosomal protein S7
MSRRHRAEKRKVIPDAKYGDEVLTKFMNSLMLHGKKSTAESIIYGALEKVEGKLSREPLGVFHEALENIMPAVEVRSRRVGGATYQVPVEVRPERRQALAIRWLITAARARGENTMVDRLSGELMDAVNNRGSAVKKHTGWPTPTGLSLTIAGNKSPKELSPWHVRPNSKIIAILASWPTLMRVRRPRLSVFCITQV